MDDARLCQPCQEILDYVRDPFEWYDHHTLRESFVEALQLPCAMYSLLDPQPDGTSFSTIDPHNSFYLQYCSYSHEFDRVPEAIIVGFHLIGYERERSVTKLHMYRSTGDLSGTAAVFMIF